MRRDWAKKIQAWAPKYGIDPKAALAVSMMEGLSGRVGDGGHAFGPFQLNDAGGVLTNRPGNHRAFAESDEGIKWALERMAQAGARGKKGHAAIDAIVRNFERPANPDAEVAGARSRYGSGGGEVGGPSGAPVAAQSVSGASGGSSGAPDQMRFALLSMLMQNNASYASGKPSSQGSMLPALMAMRMSAKQGNPASLAQAPTGPAKAPAGKGTTFAPAAEHGALNEMFYDPIGGYDSGKDISAIGGHNDHVHAAFNTPKAMLAALKLGKSMGLSERENPYTDKVDPVHTNGSFHYKTYAGTYNGKKLGEATDFSGPADKMAAFYKLIRQRYGG